MWVWLAACNDDPRPKVADTDETLPSTGETAVVPTGDTGSLPTGDTGTVEIPSLCNLPSYPHRITAPPESSTYVTPVIGPDGSGDGCGAVWFSNFGASYLADQGQPADLVQETFDRTWNAPTPAAGGVWVPSVFATFWVTAVPAAPTDPATIAVGSLDLVGDALVSIGDLDGDGLDDVIASDTSNTGGLGWWTAPFDRDQTAADAQALWTGIEFWNGSAARAELLATGDLTGDGLPDLLVGAPYAEHVYLLSDPPRAPGRLMDVAIAGAVTPWAVESHLGSGLGVGDLDGDGAAEWVAADEFVGEIYAVPGSWVGFVDLTTAPMTLTWDGTNTEGGDLAVGDVDGDGADDVVVGDPWRGGYYGTVGALLVLHGPLALGTTDLEAAATRVPAPDPNAMSFGRELVIGDLDPDVGLELVVGGAVGNPNPYAGADAPAVWIYQDL